MLSLFTAHSVAEPALWIGFIIGVTLLLILDVVIIHGRAHSVQLREALIESALWIGVALAFNLWFAWRYGHELGLEFLTGYVVEKSLSLDNLFVILLTFSALRIPAKYQHKVLFWGIVGAVVMRGTLILVGTELLHRFHWIIYVFGAILIISAIRFLRDDDDTVDVDGHWSVRLLNRFIPVTTELKGHAFFIKENGVRMATSLFVALVVVEAMDLVFAVDSIPAVLAVTQDSFIAFGSNILAILGLRALYFVLAAWVARMVYLKQGLAAILGFVGCKMLLSDLFHVPAWASLFVIAAILIGASLASARAARKLAASQDPPEGPEAGPPA